MKNLDFRRLFISPFYRHECIYQNLTQFVYTRRYFYAMAEKKPCPITTKPSAEIKKCCPETPGKKPCCVVGPQGPRPLPSRDVLEKLKLGYENLQASDSKSLLRKNLTRDVFDKLKYKVTLQGSTLLDVVQSGFINLDSGVGVYCPDEESYSLYSLLIDRIIADYHGFGPDDVHPCLDWGNPDSLSDLDPDGKYIRSTRVRCGRSIAGYPFNPKMTLELYQKMEKDAVNAFSQLDGVHAGKYESLSSMTPEYQQQLIDDHYLFKEGDKFLIASNSCQFWPEGRGIFMNSDKTFLVWVGEEDHLRIISMQMGGNLGEVYKRMVEGVNKMEKNLRFVRHPRLGFLSFCPTNLGTTIRASVMITLPKIGKDMESLEAVAEKYHLQVRGTAGEHTASADGSYDISNRRRLGLTEFQAVNEMFTGLQEMIKMEEAA